MGDRRLPIALYITSGDKERALKLLELIDMSMYKGSSFPNVKMALPKDDENSFNY